MEAALYMTSVMLCKEMFSSNAEDADRPEHGRFALACGYVGRAAKREMRLPFMGESRRIHRPVAQSMSYPSCKVFVGTQRRRRGMATNKHGEVVQLAAWRSRRFLGSSDGRGAVGTNEVRPDQVPLVRTQVPTPQLHGCDCLDANRLFGSHVTAPGKALVEVGVAEVVNFSKLAAPLGGDGHDRKHSDSLGAMQAIRYRVNPSDVLEPPAMETRSERRRRKLESLCETHGLKSVASKSGQNWQSLDQIIKGVLLPKKKDGTQNARSLGDVAAQAIEDALGLGRGWFDSDDSPAPPQVKEDTPTYGVSARDRAVLAAVYAVFTETQIEEIRLKAMEKLTADAALLRQGQADQTPPAREKLLNPPAQPRARRAR